MMNATKLSSVTARFPHLQGLFLVPIGLWMMLSSSLPAWWPWRNELVAVPAAALAVAAYLRIKVFYAENYGWVTPRRSEQLWLGAGVLMALAILWAALEVDSRGLVDLSTSGVSSAILLMAYWHWAVGGFRWHHFALGLGVIAVSLLPLWSSIRPDEMFEIVGFSQGVMLAVGGLFDHAELTRLLGSVGRQQRERWGTTGGSA